MKADAITKRILDDARNNAEQSLNDARALYDQLRQDNAGELENKRHQAEQRAKLDGEELRDRMLRMAELNERKQLLAMKREVIELAFNDALKRLNDMPVEDARKFISAQILSAAEGDEQILIGKDERGVFTEEFIASLNAELTKLNKPARLTLGGETRDIKGGVILRRDGMEVNLTYAAILNEARPTLEAEVASMLFER